MWLRVFHRAEDSVAIFLLAAMAVLPVGEVLGRQFNHTIPGAQEYLQHLTLWIAFLGAWLAARSDRHLKIAALDTVTSPNIQRVLQALTGLTAATVCLFLCGASIQLVVSEAPAISAEAVKLWPAFVVNWLEPYGLFDPGNLKRVGGWLPAWAAEIVMPLGFLAMGVRFVIRAGKGWLPRIIAGLAFPLCILLPWWFSGVAGYLVWPGVLILILAALAGAPIFTLLGGVALLLFWGADEPVAAIPAETYRIVTNPYFPAIPIFTLTGFILSESDADQRLVRLFRAWFGWFSGGTAVAATIMCAFFTTFTGASGVTILAVGGVLFPVLLARGFSERFSLGLVTATGSLGLLLPPSLVVILYAVLAEVPVTDMFLAGIVPGTLLVLAICGYCMVCGMHGKVKREPFEAKEAWQSLWAAKWEVLIPLLALFVIFGGFCTIVEAGAIMALYTLVVEMAVYRNLPFRRLFGMLRECGTLVGGVLIILGVAMGLTNYLIDHEVPQLAVEWASENIGNPYVFLLLLNVALILVGCMMDIYSALVVIVPIILPMAEAFGIHPAHLGVIFLANLELGYLTPPIGMNLFLSSFRFERPLPQVYRASVPFLLILLAVVLLITFVPWLTLGPMRLFK